MAEFKDFTLYTYILSGRSKTINIGWLGTRYPFPKADPSPEILDALWRFCRAPVQRTRGWHPCPFCAPAEADVIEVEWNGETATLATAEIRVFPLVGTFAAPTLIFHYVGVHRYRPPDQFIEALLDGPQPGSAEYAARLTALDLDLDS